MCGDHDFVEWDDEYGRGSPPHVRGPLPGAMDSDWKAVVGFDLETRENSYGIDWDEYAKKVDEILAEIEEEQTKEE
jgi:hypothetical protein